MGYFLLFQVIFDYLKFFYFFLSQVILSYY
jgi:hypothetical protein